MNTNITLPGGLTRAFGRGKLLAQKHSPEILLGVGLIGVVASSVMLVKATVKAVEMKPALDKDAEEKNTIIEAAHNAPEPNNYTEEDYQKDKLIVKVQNVMPYVKLYAPAAITGLASITAIVGSHGIMTRRTTSLVAAYGLLQEGFAAYRKRVVEDLGEDKDREFRFDLGGESVKVTMESDEAFQKRTKKEKEEHLKRTTDPNGLSDYAKFFDEYSVQYRNDPSLNLFFLKSQQNYANDKLKANGFLFLNEVYEMLGLPRTKAGAIVGWVWGTKDEQDGYVDFGLYEAYNADSVNGYETVFIIDPNVDGVIYDLLPA